MVSVNESHAGVFLPPASYVARKVLTQVANEEWLPAMFKLSTFFGKDSLCLMGMES